MIQINTLTLPPCLQVLACKHCSRQNFLKLFLWLLFTPNFTCIGSNRSLICTFRLDAKYKFCVADTLFYTLWKNCLNRSFFLHTFCHTVSEPFIKKHQCLFLLTSMQCHHVGISNTRWLLIAWCSYHVSWKFVKQCVSYWEK